MRIISIHDLIFVYEINQAAMQRVDCRGQETDEFAERVALLRDIFIFMFFT